MITLESLTQVILPSRSLSRHLTLADHSGAACIEREGDTLSELRVQTLHRKAVFGQGDVILPGDTALVEVADEQGLGVTVTADNRNAVRKALII